MHEVGTVEEFCYASIGRKNGIYASMVRKWANMAAQIFQPIGRERHKVVGKSKGKFPVIEELTIERIRHMMNLALKVNYVIIKRLEENS